MNPFGCSRFDLNAAGLLPDDWNGQVQAISDAFGVHTWLDGKSSTSREPEDSAGCSVSVVTGDVIKANLPWLDALYRGPLLEYASSTSSEKIVPSLDIRSAVNINLIRGVDSRYEWHVDSNPLTGILYATDHDSTTGGELVFQKTPVREVIWPKTGLFIVFNAQDMPHSVMPLKRDTVRISIPMNYFIDEKPQDRPSDLDQYIYSPTLTRPTLKKWSTN